MKPLNIIYIHSHDTGRYTQPYGHAVETPNMQELAEQGTLFTQAFSAAPTCSPSRAALLTGQCPHSNGMFGLVNRGFELPDCSRHIVNVLKDNGYYTVLAGIQHIVRDVEKIGYDKVYEQRAYEKNAIDFIEKAPQQPFFLDIGFYLTHRIFPEGSEKDEKYSLPPAPLPNCKEIRKDMAAYKQCVRMLDDRIGQVLDALHKNNLTDSTLIILTTDHGLAFPNMKCRLTDHGIGVNLIIKGTKDFNGGRVYDSLISHIDIFPTICEILNIEKPQWLQGKSILPIVRNEQEEINESVFAEVNYHCCYEPQRCVRTNRYKYIKRFDETEQTLLPNCDQSLSKDKWLEHGWQHKKVETEQLYDLIFDPGETHNIAGDAETQDILEEMRRRLDQWMKETNDPLLRGPITEYCTNTNDGRIFVSKNNEVNTNDLWAYTKQDKGYV